MVFYISDIAKLITGYLDLEDCRSAAVNRVMRDAFWATHTTVPWDCRRANTKTVIIRREGNFKTDCDVIVYSVGIQFIIPSVSCNVTVVNVKSGRLSVLKPSGSDSVRHTISTGGYGISHYIPKYEDGKAIEYRVVRR